MKLIALTQRIDFIKDYGEIRDSIDQNWNRILLQSGFNVILIPNNKILAENLIKTVNIEGIILTGGNTLSKYGGDAFERDEVEKFLIKYAIEKDIPLLGVCRGMQMIQDYFGVKLLEIKGHVKVQHTIRIENNIQVVNSYHNFGAYSSTDELQIIAKSEDGVVESIKHEKYKIFAIMWHIERNTPFLDTDILILKKIFGDE